MVCFTSPLLRTVGRLLVVGLFACGEALAAEDPESWIGQAQRQRGAKTLFRWPGAAPEESDAPEEEEPIQTDRPDFTEASSTVGRGRAQLEFGYTFVHDREGNDTLNAHSFPETLLRVGLLAEWLEFRVAWNYGVETTGNGVTSTTISAADDLYLGMKFALTEQDGIWPEMVLLPQMTVPTAPVAAFDATLPLPIDPNGFGSGEVMPGLNWLYGWDITSFLSLGGSTQGNRARDDSGVFYTEFAQSMTIGYTLTEKLGAYTEWFGLFPHGAVDSGTRAQHYFDGGFTYKWTNDLQFDVRAGVGLNQSADDYFLGTGAAYRY